MSNIQPKKQDLDGVEYLSANESTNIKISGDDSSSSGARIELGKDLTTAPIISHLSGDGFDFGVLGNFTFPQMILSKQKLQAVVTPLPATDTLKINKKILLDDGAGNTGTLDINGTDLEISSSGNQLLGGVVTIDTTNNRVGINVPNPTEDFEIDGNIQMNTGATSKIVFYDTPNAHEHGEIDADGELTDGGVIKFQTKVDGGSVTEKLRINNIGAISIGGGANYGTSGQVLTSNGSTSAVSWTTPSGGGGISSFAFFTLNTPQSITSIRPANAILVYDNIKTTDPTSNIVLDTIAPNAGRIDITDAGTYKIDVTLTADAGSGNRIVSIGQLFINGTADTNCICYAYGRDINNGENTGNINAILTLTANSYLEVFVSKTINQPANAIVGTNIAIMKIA